MKVIKSGMNCKKKDRTETMRVICKHCNTELEISAMNVRVNFTLLGKKCYFECPHCKSCTRVKLKNMTENFKYWVKIWHIRAF